MKIKVMIEPIGRMRTVPNQSPHLLSLHYTLCRVHRRNDISPRKLHIGTSILTKAGLNPTLLRRRVLFPHDPARKRSGSLKVLLCRPKRRHPRLPTVRVARPDRN